MVDKEQYSKLSVVGFVLALLFDVYWLITFVFWKGDSFESYLMLILGAYISPLILLLSIVFVIFGARSIKKYGFKGKNLVMITYFLWAIAILSFLFIFF